MKQASAQETLAIVGHSPQLARIYAEEELLTNWAEKTLALEIDHAAFVLREGREIGDALASKSRDLMLHDAVAAIDRADPSKLRLLSEGHRVFALGLRQTKSGDYQTAVDTLVKARDLLERGGSPFAAWAVFYIALADYQHSDYGEALNLLGQIQTLATRGGYRSLEGRALWLRGTILVFQSRFTDSLIAYQQARQIFGVLGEEPNKIGVDTLLARNLELLGDSSTAWEYRIEALAGAAQTHDGHRLRVTLAEAASAIADMGEPAVARYLQEEAVNVAERLNDPLARTAALRQLAAIQFRMGDFAEARANLDWAREAAAAISDNLVRQSVETETAIVEAETNRESTPRKALQGLDQAIANSVAMHDRLFLPSLYFERGSIARWEIKMEPSTTLLELSKSEKRSGGRFPTIRTECPTLIIATPWSEKWSIFS
ncbi:MAG: tetratricopeptide repeat protein [Thermoanaerobaculia bacterium]